MLAELHKCPSLFATTDGQVAVMIRMTADAERLHIVASSAAGSTFAAELDESALGLLKDKASKRLNWERFFDELQVAFNNGKVVSNDPKSVTCNLSVEGEKCEFGLSPSSEDGQKLILEALLGYHYAHTHPKEVEKQLEEATRREQEVKTNSSELLKEEQQLNAVITRSTEQDEANQKRLAELQTELARVEAQKKAAGEFEDDDGDEESAICRTRNPLGPKNCKNVDHDLLKLVKSQFLNDGEGVHNAVVRPMTSSEYAQYTQTFTNSQKQALWEVMQKIDDWDYDVFKLQRTMSGDDHYSLAAQHNGGSLFMTMYALLFKTGTMQKFKMEEQTVVNWISVVEAGYHGNPYHNSMHAADVLHICHFILTKGGLAKKLKLKDEDVFAALFAAAIHDFDHPGINNSFHIRAQTYLATLYNDRSVLENRHVSAVFELMKLPKFNLLASFTDDQRRDIRDTIIEMVLATDMGLHGKIVGNWKRRIGENHFLDEKKEDQRLALSMALKMADISNCGRPHDLYMRWGAKISDEFYMQGDREKNHGLSISPFMDRASPGVSKSQISFMNFVVVPMFESISEFLPDMHFSVDLTEQNKQYWMEHQDL
jgi:3',5'-cyclic-nucleotide phosphodiesterase